MIETKHVENLTQQVRQVMADEVTIEDRLNEEVREILAKLFRRDEPHRRVLSGNVQEGEEASSPAKGSSSSVKRGMTPTCD